MKALEERGNIQQTQLYFNEKKPQKLSHSNTVDMIKRLDRVKSNDDQADRIKVYERELLELKE